MYVATWTLEDCSMHKHDAIVVNGCLIAAAVLSLLLMVLP